MLRTLGISFASLLMLIAGLFAFSQPAYAVTCEQQEDGYVLESPVENSHTAVLNASQTQLTVTTNGRSGAWCDYPSLLSGYEVGHSYTGNGQFDQDASGVVRTTYLANGSYQTVFDVSHLTNGTYSLSGAISVPANDGPLPSVDTWSGTFVINNRVIGQCGGAAKNYAYDASGYTGSFCNAGTVSPTSPAFPTQGGSTQWVCQGVNGGIDDSCLATRNVPPNNPVSCTPASQNVLVGQTVNLSVSGGNGNYSWSAPGSTNTSGTGSAFSTGYTSVGSKTVSVVSDGQSATCAVGVSTNNSVPRGSHVLNDASTCTVEGWAYDPDDVSPLDPVSVRIYVDGTPVRAVTANQPSTSNVSCPQGNCRFIADLSNDLTPGVTYNIEVRALDNQDSQLKTLDNSPKTITCTTVPVEPLICRPVTTGGTPQEVAINQTVNFTAEGGTGTYAWSSPGGSPTGQSASTNIAYTTRYSTSGSKVVTLSSGDDTASCYVNVTNTPPPSGVSCSPATGRSVPGTPYTFTASGGNGVYSWTAPAGGSATNGTGGTFDISYPSEGTRTITVTSNGVSGTCNLVVRYEFMCLPVSQTVEQGQTASFQVYGRPSYSTLDWDVFPATDASPSHQDGGLTFETIFNKTGNKQVQIAETYGAPGTPPRTAVCQVNVTSAPVPPPSNVGTIVVTSNRATTWTLTGPKGVTQTQNLPSTGRTYAELEIGTYTLAPATLAGYDYTITECGTSNSTCSQPLGSDETRAFSIVYTDIGGPTEVVDIEVNGEDGPVGANYNDPVDITWTSTGVDNDCAGTGGYSWSGSHTQIGGPFTTDPITGNVTFGLSCTGSESGDTISDSVLVQVDIPECSDGEDNDGDGDIDDADQDCENPEDPTETPTQCNDGIDNESAPDGLIDYPDDPGCVDEDDDDESDFQPQCSDGIDNEDPEDEFNPLADEDDPACHTDGNPANLSSYDPDHPSEDDPGIAECNDGIDNDGDGNVDGDDAECTSPTDNNEGVEPKIIEQ